MIGPNELGTTCLLFEQMGPSFGAVPPVFSVGQKREPKSMGSESDEKHKPMETDSDFLASPLLRYGYDIYWLTDINPHRNDAHERVLNSKSNYSFSCGCVFF